MRFRNVAYSPFSIWAFNAANASMSPKVVAAAWF